MVVIHSSSRHFKHLQALVILSADSVESEIKCPISHAKMLTRLSWAENIMYLTWIWQQLIKMVIKSYSAYAKWVYFYWDKLSHFKEAKNLMEKSCANLRQKGMPQSTKSSCLESSDSVLPGAFHHYCRQLHTKHECEAAAVPFCRHVRKHGTHQKIILFFYERYYAENMTKFFIEIVCAQEIPVPVFFNRGIPKQPQEVETVGRRSESIWF